MKPFDQNYKLLNEMYRGRILSQLSGGQDTRNWLQEVIDLLESGETD